MGCYSQKRKDPVSYQQHHSTLQQTRNDDFSPPAGPPPGWEWGQVNNRPASFALTNPPNVPGLYQRPNSSHYPSEGHYHSPQSQVANYNPGHLAPYGTNPQPPVQELQQFQQRPTSASSWHSQPNSRPVSGSMIFPPSMYAWWNSDSNLGSFVEFGREPKGEPMFSGKVSMSSGKITLRRDKFKRNGEHLGEAKLKNSTSSKYLIKLPNGQEIEYSSGFQFPYRGAVESWSWASAGKSIGDKLTDKLNEKLTGKEKSLQLIGQSTGVIAATLSAEGDSISDLSLTSSKKQIGRFDFKGPVLSGELRDDFATLAIMAFLRVKQKEAEKQLVKAIFKGVGGI